jgi:polyribonucleotide nucleotidyltransferase
MDMLCWGPLRQLYADHSLDKQGRDARMFQIRDDVIAKVRELKPAWDPAVLNDVFSAVSRDAVRSLIFEENIRVDGR